MVNENANKISDIRWVQRLQNLSKAFEQFKNIVLLPKLNFIEEQGLIQCFEYNFELSWNTIKDFYTEQGETDIQGSLDAFCLAYWRGLLEDGDLWMDMIRSRALTAHAYNIDTAEAVLKKIREQYYPAIAALLAELQSRVPCNLD